MKENREQEEGIWEKEKTMGLRRIRVAKKSFFDTLLCVEYHSSEMPTNLKLNDELIEATVKLGNFKSKQEAVNTALAEYVHRRQRLRMLDLAGKINFDPKWDYKKMRRGH